MKNLKLRLVIIGRNGFDKEMYIFKGIVPNMSFEGSSYVGFEMMGLTENILPDFDVESFLDLVEEMSDKDFEVPDLTKVTLNDLKDFMTNEKSGIVIETTFGGFMTREQFIDKVESYYVDLVEDEADFDYIESELEGFSEAAARIAASFREYYKKQP